MGGLGDLMGGGRWEVGGFVQGRDGGGEGKNLRLRARASFGGQKKTEGTKRDRICGCAYITSLFVECSNTS